MNLTDLLVIYLACGAPFGVYYFFQNRAAENSNALWLKTFVNFVFWMPFAVRLLLGRRAAPPFAFSSNSSAANSEQAANLQTTIKRIESILLQSDLKISVYELREILERYIGLTIAAHEKSAPDQEAAEIFRIAENAQIELGAICLHRRNRQRLIRHQIEARRDFLQIVRQLIERGADESKLAASAIKLVENLNDAEAANELEKIFALGRQTAPERIVPKTEKDLWKPETPKLSPVREILYRSPNMKPTLNLHRKD